PFLSRGCFPCQSADALTAAAAGAYVSDAAADVHPSPRNATTVSPIFMPGDAVEEKEEEEGVVPAGGGSVGPGGGAEEEAPEAAACGRQRDAIGERHGRPHDNNNSIGEEESAVQSLRGEIIRWNEAAE
ncbi:hypothetical protein BHE74_00054605, partial [Ensete ventricosum]